MFCSRSCLLQPQSFSASVAPWGQCCVRASLCREQSCRTCTGFCEPVPHGQSTACEGPRSTQRSTRPFCCGKHTFVATKDVFCPDKHVFVATKLILVTAPAIIYLLVHITDPLSWDENNVIFHPDRTKASGKKKQLQTAFDN